jgi:hypothetical protein
VGGAGHQTQMGGDGAEMGKRIKKKKKKKKQD